MKEVKQPKRPLILFYLIVILCLILFNITLLPNITEPVVKEVDYGTFMKETEDGNIDKVEIKTNEIDYTLKNDTTTYKTGVMTSREYDAPAPSVF